MKSTQTMRGGRSARLKILGPVALATAIFLAGAWAVLPEVACAGPIRTGDIVAVPQHTTGSGNGTLDLRMFTFSGSEIKNTAGAFNGDNGNNAMPNLHGPGDDGSFGLSYVTTAGELKSYFSLNFPTMPVSEIVLFLDLNETTGTAQQYNTLSTLDVILNPTSIQGNPDPFGDVLSSEQAAINQVYSGGALLAYLDPQPALNLPVNSQGAGFADYAIFTGIDPFALDDSDVLLFNVGMNDLSNGTEELFLSGTYGPADIPEPATVGLLGLGLIFVFGRRRTLRE